MKGKEKVERPKPFMLRLSDEDKALFVAAAKEDGYDELAAWFRWLARSPAKKVLASK
jgi:hypothetical protein